jgi:ferric-dicitrate binding protein FerR (iron transport regulator)
MTDGNRESPFDDARDEDVMSQLLRLAGARPEVPTERAARVRQAVHLHWTSVSRQRVVRRRVALGAAALAAAATIALIVRTTSRENSVTSVVETVATIERAEGKVRLVRDGGDEAAWVTLTPGTAIRTGEWLETDASALAALRLAADASARFDSGSRVRLLSATVIELADGALYLDTGPEPSSGRPAAREKVHFEVRTPFGTARDVGTQFEVRLEAASLRLRVRRGAVEIRRSGAEVIAAPAGIELLVTDGGLQRTAVLPYGSEWTWATRLAPPFDIEGRSLGAFLDYLAREHGWAIRFEDSALEAEASRTILHGSVRGLDPSEALDVALATSGLSSTFRDGDLIVSRATQSK